MDKNTHFADFVCELCYNTNPLQMICQKCTNNFLCKSQTLKNILCKENKENFDHISLQLNEINEKRYKAAFARRSETQNNVKEIAFRTTRITRNENIITILKDKKRKIKENLEKLKKQIDDKKNYLSSEQIKLHAEKTQEKNLKIIAYNIRKQTFSFVLEKLMNFTNFNSKKYFYFTEYIISDLKTSKDNNNKNNSVKSFSDIDNVLSTRRISVDVNKLVIQNNDFKSIRIKTSLPSKAYDKFNEYIYKVSFAINKLSNLFTICLPNETDENSLTIRNPFSDKYINYSIRNCYFIIFNPNSEQHCENGYILLEQNINHLKKLINNEKSSNHIIDLSDFLDVSSMILAGPQTQKAMLISEEKFTGHDEDFNNFTFIEDYFR